LNSDRMLDRLEVPIVLAPLAGGPSTPELTAAVGDAGGFGFLAAGYLTASVLAERLERVRALTDAPIGVNLFVPGTPASPRAVDAYAKRLVTVTNPAEARHAAGAGADALVVQGAEAGGHRATFRDDPAEDPGGGFGLLSLLQLVRAQVDLPLVATGGIATGAAIAAVLVAGAAAAQLGTAFLRCPEAGTAEVHREALAGGGSTAMTRAFTGRLARGIRNRFLDRHSDAAPVAYPEVHHLTAPLRQAGRAGGDPGLVNLWAGQSFELGREQPAGELVRVLADEALAAIRQAGQRWARQAE
jgi:nitronate monooxygenase